MHWFRTRSKLGSWLALFALAFQIAVSFGHVHLRSSHLDANGLRHASALAGVLPGVLPDHASTDVDSAAPPASDDPPALADDYCAICALIQLAGTVVAAQAPALPVPAAFGRTQADPPAQFGLTARSHALFAARAPPTA